MAALAHLGYDCIGVDFAPQTVALLRGQVPELDIRLEDVRRLDFAADSFAGYWSLGVIEHFWDGYQDIGVEITRVVRPGGYLFITFPYLSPLRRLKARLNLYPVWENDHQPPDFYQFCLDRHQVTWDFARWGFELIKVRPFDGLKGTKSEIHPLSGPLQRLYDYRGGSFPIRALRWALSESLAIACAHAVLLIFKKKTSESERW